MTGRAAAAFLSAAVLAVGCNVILDKEALKGEYDDSDLECEGGRLDPRTDLCWQYPKADGSFEWQEAVDYCENLTLAGHSDWILPSIDDFIDLLGGCENDVLDGDSGNCNSCDESEACGALFDQDENLYWSSSPYDFYSSWRANFDSGYVKDVSIGYFCRVRCVR